MVTPPDQVLEKGNEKFKTSIVGTFTKGTVLYNKVVEFAHKAWDARGTWIW